MTSKITATGRLLKALRQQQELSQEALALRAGSSSRYISFIETGRAHPGRALLLRLARELETDYQVCCDLLVSAGYSPLQSSTATEEEQAEVLSTLKQYIDSTPYPAVITDRYGSILSYNPVMAATVEAFVGKNDYLDGGKANIYLLELDPALCRPFIANLSEHENCRLKTLQQLCLLYPDDSDFRELHEQLEEFRQTEISATDENTGQHFFSQLHFVDGSTNIRFYWFYGAFGSDANQLLDDLQVISAIPADAETKQWFQSLTSNSDA